MCIFCGSKIKKDVREYIEKQGNLVVLIKNVPCEACLQCGEIYFDTNTAIGIEKILANVGSDTEDIALTVLDYA